MTNDENVRNFQTIQFTLNVTDMYYIIVFEHLDRNDGLPFELHSLRVLRNYKLCVFHGVLHNRLCAVSARSKLVIIEWLTCVAHYALYYFFIAFSTVMTNSPQRPSFSDASMCAYEIICK